MAVSVIPIYRSSNGDRWSLAAIPRLDTLLFDTNPMPHPVVVPPIPMWTTF